MNLSFSFFCYAISSVFFCFSRKYFQKRCPYVKKLYLCTRKKANSNSFFINLN